MVCSLTGERLRVLGAVQDRSSLARPIISAAYAYSELTIPRHPEQIR